MPKKTFTPEQIVGKLRQIEVLVSQGKTVPLACKEAGIVDQTFYRWRKEYGGLQLEQARKLIRSAEGKRAAPARCCRFDGGEADSEGHHGGKLLSPERRRIAVHHAREKGLSERRACRLVRQPRGRQRYQPTQRNDEDRLTQAIVALAMATHINAKCPLCRLGRRS